MDKSQRKIRLKPLDLPEQMVDSCCSRLISLAEGYSIPLSRDQVELCLEHLLYVYQVNSYINLTSVTTLDEGIIIHILDSLLFTLPLQDNPASLNFLDMGTGAGFPGIPFHIATGCSGTLLDAVQKKVNVVNAISDELQLDGIEAVHDRLEHYAADGRNKFDLVLARALAPLPTLIEYAAPFLTNGGSLVVSKGIPSTEEIEAGDKAATVCGLVRSNSLHLSLPEDLGQRTIITYEQVGTSSVDLPRAVGMARKHPLG